MNLKQHISAGIILVLLWMSACSKQQMKERASYYKNPVIAGDFPDPSIIRVGETYYATGTSFDFGPSYPIYESSDLINWERISSVFNEPPRWSSDDFWAPELFYLDSTFYMYYTSKRRDNGIACIGVATSKNIYNGFTDHGILIEWGDEAIDAFVFQDDDDSLYITWKAYGLTKDRKIELLASALSADGLRLVGESFTLTDHAKGWRGSGDEGQCIVKRNGMYYLIYSIGGCCDHRCDYRVMVARSKNLKSGWQQYPKPILQGGVEWLCPGHGTLVSTPDNRDFYLYHAYHEKDFEFIGRQGMLDEMLWDEKSGWPYFKHGTPSVVARAPFNGTHQQKDSTFYDDFSTAKNMAFWEWDINQPKPSVKLSEGNISITKTHEGIAFLGLRPKTGDYTISSEVISSSDGFGIGVYSNERNLIALTKKDDELTLFQVKNGEKETLAKTHLDDTETTYLMCEANNGHNFHFSWSENGEDWQPLNAGDDDLIEGTFTAQWGFSPRIGFVMNGDKSTTASYSEIKVEYKYYN